MKKINLAITGCLGRMGQQIIKSCKSDKNFNLVTLTEDKKINKKIYGIKVDLNTEKVFQKSKKLVDFNLLSILLLLELFDIRVKIERSSNFKSLLSKSERIVDILIKANATHYLSGTGAKVYHKDEPFDKAKIEVIWQNFKHPVYPQQYGDFLYNL